MEVAAAELPNRKCRKFGPRRKLGAKILGASPGTFTARQRKSYFFH